MVSQREDAIKVLVEMLAAGEDRDRISAADKILRSDKMARDYAERAIAVLREIMDDGMAEPRDRVAAADKLKNFAAPKTESSKDMALMLAAMTDEELRAGITPLHKLNDPDPLLL